MTIYEAEKILGNERLQFGNERQIKAVRILQAYEEITEFLKNNDVECPFCDESGTVECPECNGTGGNSLRRLRRQRDPGAARQVP